jgi:glycosyltransferase involved in cell wall biosynthesis
MADQGAAPGRKVLMVTSSFPRWPRDETTAFVLHLAQDLRHLGWDIRVLAPHADGAATDEVFAGVPVERFRYFWPPSQQSVFYRGGALANLRGSPLNVAKLPMVVAAEWHAVRRRLRRENFDLVHSHWILPQGLVCAKARPPEVPHVMSVHGSDIFALQGRVLRACKEMAIAGADAVTVNSSVTQEAVTKLAPTASHLHRIPMGATAQEPDPRAVDQLRARHRRGTGPLLLFVGRLVEQKGTADFIAAVELLRRTLPETTAVIVGDGPDRSRFESVTQRCGLAEHLHFAGWVDPADVWTYYAAADVFVGPSRRTADGAQEAQGLTFVEAMLAGTPVVATACGGIVDAVRDGETGLLVKESAPAEIAAAVMRLVSEPDLAARLRQAALELARRRFTRAASAEAFAALYSRLLADARR